MPSCRSARSARERCGRVHAAVAAAVRLTRGYSMASRRISRGCWSLATCCTYLLEVHRLTLHILHTPHSTLALYVQLRVSSSPLSSHTPNTTAHTDHPRDPPPSVPHRGVAQTGDCLTVSMGFRAPGWQSLVTAATAKVCEGLAEGTLLQVATDSTDTSEAGEVGGEGRASPGRLKTDVTAQVQRELHAHVDKLFGASGGPHTPAFADWLGEYLTVPLRMHVSAPSCFYVERDWDGDGDRDRDGDIDEEGRGPEEENNAAGAGAGAATTPPSFQDQCGPDGEVLWGDHDDDDEDNDDEDDDELPLCVRHPRFSVASPRSWPDVESVLNEALDGRYQSPTHTHLPTIPHDPHL